MLNPPLSNARTPRLLAQARFHFGTTLSHRVTSTPPLRPVMTTRPVLRPVTVPLVSMDAAGELSLYWGVAKIGFSPWSEMLALRRYPAPTYIAVSWGCTSIRIALPGAIDHGV